MRRGSRVPWNMGRERCSDAWVRRSILILSPVHVPMPAVVALCLRFFPRGYPLGESHLALGRDNYTDTAGHGRLRMLDGLVVESPVRPPRGRAVAMCRAIKKPGNDQLSHPQGAVPSARQGLTSLFGTGTGPLRHSHQAILSLGRREMSRNTVTAKSKSELSDRCPGVSRL